MNRRLCSPYYHVLVRREDGERADAFAGLLGSLREFSRGLEAGHSASGGPFWGGSATLTAVRVAPKVTPLAFVRSDATLMLGHNSLATLVTFGGFERWTWL